MNVLKMDMMEGDSKNQVNAPNWLDTCGRNEGTMCLRWIRASEHPQPQARVVKISDI